MNNVVNDRNVREASSSTLGQYVIEPFVSSDLDRMISWGIFKTPKVAIPLGLVGLVYFQIIICMPSNLYDYLFDHYAGPILLLGSILIILFLISSLCFIVFVILSLWSDSRSKDQTSPEHSFLIEESLSYKTNVFSLRRYWITVDAISEAVEGKVEFITGTLQQPYRNDGDGYDYPAPSQRQIKWVSSENQEERTGLATMTQPNVVILTDEHDRRITPDMVT